MIAKFLLAWLMVEFGAILMPRMPPALRPEMPSVREPFKETGNRHARRRDAALGAA